MPDLLEYKCHDFTFRHALDESLYPGTYIMHTHEEIEIYKGQRQLYCGGYGI